MTFQIFAAPSGKSEISKTSESTKSKPKKQPIKYPRHWVNGYDINNGYEYNEKFDFRGSKNQEERDYKEPLDGQPPFWERPEHNSHAGVGQKILDGISNFAENYIHFEKPPK